MISIGPLTDKNHCSFKCPFCYVKSENYQRYTNWDLSKTISWLENNSELIDIIYISGDTDSFAKPRTAKGIELLNAISFLKKDILFTTRFVFNEKELNSLSTISNRIIQNGNLAISCTSICQLTCPNLEPRPIRPPSERIQQLKNFKNAGWLPILSMRPLLPQVPLDDYEKIITWASKYTSYCLISPYYYDPASTQLKPDERTVLTGKLLFNVSDSESWHSLVPSKDKLEFIYRIAKKNNIQIFNESKKLYKLLNRNKNAQPNKI